MKNAYQGTQELRNTATILSTARNVLQCLTTEFANSTNLVTREFLRHEMSKASENIVFAEDNFWATVKSILDNENTIMRDYTWSYDKITNTIIRNEELEE